MTDPSIFNIAPTSLTLGAKLARGNGTTLYKADLKQGDRSFQVAVKKVKKVKLAGFSSDAEKAFLKEVHIAQLASATCQRACRMLGCCNINGSPCIVMSLYASSVAQRLEALQGPMSMPETVSMAVEILEGLVQLHDINVWHLDLKPANILLDNYQHAYLADFGISYALQTLQSCTVLTSCVGTPHYLAPEQTGDTFGRRGRHTDVWGFGTTILHMATGVLPYNGLNLLQMLTALMKGRPPAVPNTLPGWLQKLLRQCLMIDAAARPTVQQMLKAFQDQLQQQAGSSNDSPQQQQWHHGGSGFSGPGGYSNTGSTDRDGKPSAGQKLEKLIPGTPEYKAAQRNNSRGYDTGRDTTTGAGVAGIAEHERVGHHHGSHHGIQGTNDFGNPAAPISNTGRSAYNADGVPVSTTQTGPGLSGSSRTNSDNRGSDYRDSGNCESGITASGNRDRDNYRGSDNSQGQSHAGLMSYMPGTQACKGAHRDDGANYGGNQDRNNYNNRGRSDNYVGRDEYGLDRNNCDGRDISAGVAGFGLGERSHHGHNQGSEYDRSNTGRNQETGYGSHNTGSTAENAKSYIPGTDANRESRREQGHDTGRDSSYGRDSSLGRNQGYSDNRGSGYGSQNTGSTAENMKSYIPGTDANMESRYEQGRDTGRDSSYGRDTGRDFSYGRGNQGGDYGSHRTGSTNENAKSYIPGIDANRESRYEQGHGTGRGCSYDNNRNRNTSDYDRDTNTGSSGGLMSYIPGTPAYRERQTQNDGDSSYNTRVNDRSNGYNTSCGHRGTGDYDSTTSSNTGTGSDYQSGFRGTGATGTASNINTGSSQGTALTSGSHIPGEQGNERRGQQDCSSGSEYQTNGSTGNTGSGYNQGSGSNTGSGIKSHIPGTPEHQAKRGQGDNYGSDSQHTGSRYNQGSGSNTGSGIKSHIPGTPEHQAKRGQGDNYGSDVQHTGSRYNQGSGSNTGSGIKSHIPGTPEHKAKRGQGDNYGSDSQHTGSGHDHGRDEATGKKSHSAGLNTSSGRFSFSQFSAAGLSNNKGKAYVQISLGGRHQNTSLNTADARSPEWSETLTFEHPRPEYSDLSVAIHSKHTLLPDTLIGSAEYPLNCIVSGEQLRIPITDKSGDGAGEVTMYVDTGGYQAGAAAAGGAVGVAGLSSGNTSSAPTNAHGSSGYGSK